MEQYPQHPPPSYPVASHTKSSLDVPQRIEKKLAQYNASNNIFKRWLFELSSVAVSAICMATIIAILSQISNQPITKWPLGLTVITVLSKIASAALILPISEALGQLKWTWFHGKTSKNAFDFEIFDKASRGAWGSMMLLYRTKGKSLAALGAFLTVLLLAIDTFFQQVTDLPERWTLYGESSLPRAVFYAPIMEEVYDSSMGEEIPMTQQNNDLRKALSPFLYDLNGTQPITNGNMRQAEIPLTCPTSKCEWPVYKTLAVCSACKDVSSLLEFACLPMSMDWVRSSTGPSTERTWPNGTACGYFLNATTSNPVLMSGWRVDDSNTTRGETLLMRTLPLVSNPLRNTLYEGSINYKNITHRILDAIIVSASDGSAASVYRREVPVAQECMLAWCVKTIESSYSWGGYEEKVLDTFLNTTAIDYPWYTESDETGIYTDYGSNITLTPPAANTDDPPESFGMTNDTLLESIVIFDEVFPSFVTVANSSSRPYVKVRTSYTDRVVYRTAHFNPFLAPNNVTHHMIRLAEVFTNALRSDASSYNFIAGKAYSPQIYVAVHWAWLCFPLTMLLLSVVFLVATMIKTSQSIHSEVGMWKTSAMPTLLYSLPKETHVDLETSIAQQSKPDRNEQNMRIRLLPKQGWRVSSSTYTTPSATSLTTANHA
ncbi:hypothetical protein ACN47E_000067 [Coniothyrium glycines]